MVLSVRGFLSCGVGLLPDRAALLLKFPSEVFQVGAVVGCGVAHANGKSEVRDYR